VRFLCCEVEEVDLLVVPLVIPPELNDPKVGASSALKFVFNGANCGAEELLAPEFFPKFNDERSKLTPPELIPKVDVPEDVPEFNDERSKLTLLLVPKFDDGAEELTTLELLLPKVAPKKADELVPPELLFKVLAPKFEDGAEELT